MNNSDEWIIVGKKQKGTKNKNTKPKKEDKTETKVVHIPEKKEQRENKQVNNVQQNDVPVIVDTHEGMDIQLNSKYNVWIHDVNSKDWSINGYKTLCSIENVSEFWRFLNNINKIGLKFNNIFLMKDGIDPTWEHPDNRHGGVCSFKIELENSLPVYEDLCLHMISNKLNHDDSDINGISISPKNNWALIKIWNKQKGNDLTITLNKDIMIKYHDLSIKYKSNEPEY